MSLFLPTQEELDAQRGSYSSVPLEAEDYIAKMARINLVKMPSWNASANNYTWPLELKYEIIFLVHKPKAEEEIKNKDWVVVDPLTHWVFKTVNPFALGTQKSWEPSYMRAILGYAQGESPDPNAQIRMPGIVVLDKDDNRVSEEVQKKFVQELEKFQSKEIWADGLTLRNSGYKYIPDLKPLEGKYIGIKLTVWENGGNKLTAFSKVPTSFSPNEQVEKEAMEKFAEGYKKMLEKRKEKKENKPSTDAVVDVSGDDDLFPF